MKKTLAALFALLFFAVPALADVELSVSHWYEDDGTEYAVFIAYDENGVSIWQLETVADQIGELDAISWFETGLGGHRLLVNVTNYGLSCYDAETGNLIWHIPVSEYHFGGGCCFAADAAGNSYVGGYYGPDPLCISPEGEILWFADHGLDQDIFWLYQMLPLEEGLLSVYDAWFDGAEPVDQGGYVIYGADGTAVASGSADFSPYLVALSFIERLEIGTAGASLKLAAASAMVLNRIEPSGFWDEELFIRIADAYVDSMSAPARAAFAEKFAAADEFIRLILAGDESALAQVEDAGAVLGYARFSPEKYDLLYTAVTQALEE